MAQVSFSLTRRAHMSPYVPIIAIGFLIFVVCVLLAYTAIRAITRPFRLSIERVHETPQMAFYE